MPQVMYYIIAFLEMLVTVTFKSCGWWSGFPIKIYLFEKNLYGARKRKLEINRRLAGKLEPRSSLKYTLVVRFP